MLWRLVQRACGETPSCFTLAFALAAALRASARIAPGDVFVSKKCGRCTDTTHSDALLPPAVYGALTALDDQPVEVLGAGGTRLVRPSPRSATTLATTLKASATATFLATVRRHRRLLPPAFAHSP